MTEIELHQPQQSVLAEQMSYARAVSDGSLLPDTYRGKPANVLIAVGLGSAMGLTPAESLYRIDVISGKPTASAELIAANVRKAGHKLRVKVTEEPPSATCTIIRCDDPDEPTTITRDLAWAQRMGLVTKDNYKKQPSTMLSWRAISACARLACPEALYGVAYTSDEMFDVAPARTSGGLGAALNTTTAEQVAAPEPLTKRTRGHLFALFAQKGVAEDQQLSGANHILGTAYESRSEFTEADALRLIDVLNTRPDVVDVTDAEVVDEPS